MAARATAVNQRPCSGRDDAERYFDEPLRLLLIMRHHLDRFITLGFALTTSAAVSPLAAQGGSIDPRCATSGAAGSIAYVASVIQQDACQKSVDLFNYLAPQLGALVAGGSADLGRGGTLGGLGHFGVGVRATVLGGGRLPDVANVQLRATGATRTEFGVNSQAIALPAFDATVGLFAGVPVGLTRIGGLDLLLSGAYVPSFSAGQVRVDRTGGALQIGYGGRLGLLERSRFVPGVGLTYLHRQIPETSILATTTDGGRFGVTGARVSTDSWRLAAEQRISLVGLTVGVGQDRYDSRASVAGGLALAAQFGLGNGVLTFSEPFTQRLTRTNVYAGAAVPAGSLAQLVGEVGRASGGTSVPTYNGFSGRTPTDAYTYVSLGVRVGR